MEIDPMENELDYPSAESNSKQTWQDRETIMLTALRTLARLGNGSTFGNSIGNTIAVRALQKVGDTKDNA